MRIWAIFENLLPTFLAAAVLAVTYFAMFAPERERRKALEQHILLAARSIHIDNCREAMTADNIDPARFRDAGGFVSYEPFGEALYMALNIAFLDNTNKRLFCTVSLAPTARVYLWEPDE